LRAEPFVAFVKMHLLFFSLIAFTAFAQPSPPSAQMMMEWIAFSQPVHLSAEKTQGGDFAKWGEVVWVYGYNAKQQSLHYFFVGLYKAGTLFGENRAEYEKKIEEGIEKAKDMQGYFSKHIRIETRPDGRKVYFSPMGLGPGGAAFGAFTRLRDYDLLLFQLVSSEDDTPADEKLKIPARPTNELPDIFRKLEQHITQENQPQSPAMSESEPFIAFLGTYSNMRYTEEHAYGTQLDLWQQNEEIFGHFLHSMGLMGDTPTGRLENLIFDPKNGRLAFTARLTLGLHYCREHEGTPSRDVFEFEGVFSREVITGTLTYKNAFHPETPATREEITLRKIEEKYFGKIYKTRAEWEEDSRQILMFRGPKW
jgi:hypothetical protein